MRLGVKTFLVILAVVAFLSPSAFAETKASSDLSAKLDQSAELLDDGSYGKALVIIEKILEEDAVNARALRLYLRANKQKQAAEKKAADIMKKVEEGKAMKEVDDAARIPEKEITHEPPLTRKSRVKSTLSQEMQAMLNQRVSLNLIDGELSYVLDLLATTTGINIVTDRSIIAGQRLDIHVEDARLADLLDYIAANSGIEYMVNESGVWITTPQQPQLQIRVFHLRYGVTRTGAAMVENELANQGESSTFGPSSSRTSNTSGRTNTSRRYPSSYRRYYAPGVEDVPLDSKIDEALGGGGSDRAFRSQMMSTMANLMRQRATQLNAPSSNQPGSTNRQNNANGDNSKKNDMEKLLDWISGWSGTLQWPVGSNWRFEPKTNSLIVVSTPEMLDKVESLIDEFDVPPIQINIRTRFITVKVQEGMEWGIQGLLESALGSGGDSTSKRTQFDPGSGWNLNVPSGADATGATMTFRGILTDPQYRIVMHALQTDLNGRLLSEPNITTLSNEPARLMVAEEYPYPTDWEAVQSTTTNDGATTSSTTAFVPTDFETENVGITLDVMPSVGSDIDTIILELHPQIVARDPNKDAKYNIISNDDNGDPQAFEVTRPTFARQEIITKVVIRSGETVVLGGLINEEDVTTVSKVPILGDIPGLGVLFRRTSKQKTRSNLLIFVTAEIIDTRGRFYHPKDKKGSLLNGGRDIMPEFVPSAPPNGNNADKPAEDIKPSEKTSPETSPKPKVNNEKTGEEKPDKAVSNKPNRHRRETNRPFFKVTKRRQPRIGRKK